MSFLSKIFGGGQKQAPAPVVPEAPPPPPTVDTAALNRDQADRLRRRKGARSTIMVAGDGGLGGSAPATKSVLG
jgi:hypothetical protein